MAIALSPWFDEPLERSVRDLWRAIADAGISDELHIGPYRPHVTLGIWQWADARALERALLSAGRAIVSTPIGLSEFGTFGDPAAVSWLGPDSRGQLLELKRRTDALVQPHVRDPLPYTSEHDWNPHCTLACNLKSPEQVHACRSLAEPQLPLARWGMAVGIVDTPAEIEMAPLEISPPQP